MLKKSLDDIVSEGKKYVDDLYTSSRLAPISREYGEILFADSYDGLGVAEAQSNEFRTLYDYL